MVAFLLMKQRYMQSHALISMPMLALFCYSMPASVVGLPTNATTTYRTLRVLSMQAQVPTSFETSTPGECPANWTCTGEASVANEASNLAAQNIDGSNYLAFGYDRAAGTAQSPSFILPDNVRAISFLRAGGGDEGGLYVYLAADDSQICAAENGYNSNEFFEDMCTDLESYAGQLVYIRVEDRDTNGWDKVFVDRLQFVQACASGSWGRRRYQFADTKCPTGTKPEHPDDLFEGSCCIADTAAVADTAAETVRSCKARCTDEGYCCGRDSGCQKPSCHLGCEIASGVTSMAECEFICNNDAQSDASPCDFKPAGAFESAGLCQNCRTGGGHDGQCGSEDCEPWDGCVHACSITLGVAPSPVSNTASCCVRKDPRTGECWDGGSWYKPNPPDTCVRCVDTMKNDPYPGACEDLIQPCASICNLPTTTTTSASPSPSPSSAGNEEGGGGGVIIAIVVIGAVTILVGIGVLLCVRYGCRRKANGGDKDRARTHGGASEKARAWVDGHDFYFVSCEKLLASRGPLRKYQELVRQNGWLKLQRVKLSDCLRGLQGGYAAVSHVWLDIEHPDVKGEQANALRSYLMDHPEIQWVWIDWCCLPQKDGSAPDKDGRTAKELAEFDEALKFMNLVYLAIKVVKIVDKQYMARFWPQYEAWLSYQWITSEGFNQSPHDRSDTICTGAAKSEEEIYKAQVKKELSTKSMYQVIEYLQQSDVAVANRKDKTTQIENIVLLNNQLAKVWTDLELQSKESKEPIPVQAATLGVAT